MSTFTQGVWLLLGLCGPAMAATAEQPDARTLEAALGNYLVQHGDLCLGKYDWPIKVSAADFELRTRDAVQLPVLEALGLATSTEGTIVRSTEEGEQTIPGRRYELTEKGLQSYRVKDFAITTSSGARVEHHGDFCAGKLSLHKVVSWSPPQGAGGQLETTVNYTYKLTAADWARTPEARKVFPVVDRMLKGEGTLQLQQRLRFDGSNWVAVQAW
jgi:hypothetical protein